MSEVFHLGSDINKKDIDFLERKDQSVAQTLLWLGNYCRMLWRAGVRRWARAK